MAAEWGVSGMDSAARARDGAQRGNSPAQQDGRFALTKTPGGYEKNLSSHRRFQPARRLESPKAKMQKRLRGWGESPGEEKALSM